MVLVGIKSANVDRDNGGTGISLYIKFSFDESRNLTESAK